MPPVKVRLVAPPPKEAPRPPPPPPPPAEVKPPPPPPPPTKEKEPPKPPPPPKEEVKPPPPPENRPPPPPPPQEPAKEPEVKPPAPPEAPKVPAPGPAPAGPAPRRSFSASLDSSQTGGGVAVPTRPGGGRDGDPRSRGDRGSGKSPAGEGSGDGVGSAAGSGSAPEVSKPVEAATVTSLPGLLSKPSDDELRGAYLDAARQKGLDGNVGLEILVSAEGRVLKVRVTKPAGDGFDEVAVRFVKRHRFRPARKAGQSVAVWIPWTYKFRLGD